MAGASALSVTSRLWLGGVVQIRRDRALLFVRSSKVCVPAALSMSFCFAPMGWQLTLSRRSRCLARHCAPASEVVLGFVCRRASW